MQKKTPSYDSALSSLNWAVLLSLIFLCIGTGLGLILAFSANIPSAGVILSAAMIVVSLVLTRLFTPPAQRAAVLQKDREAAVVCVFRRYFVLICSILSAAAVTAPLLFGLSASDYFSLLPILIAALALGISIASHLLRRRLQTTAERNREAAIALPRNQNFLAVVLIFCANLALLSYRLFWMLSGYENDTVNLACILGYALFTLVGLLLPLFSFGGHISRRVKLLCLLRNFCIAAGLTAANLSIAFLRLDTEQGVSINYLALLAGIAVVILSFVGFRLILRRGAKKS